MKALPWLQSCCPASALAYIYCFQFSTAETYSYIVAELELQRSVAFDFVDEREQISPGIGIWEGRVGVRGEDHKFTSE